VTSVRGERQRSQLGAELIGQRRGLDNHRRTVRLGIIARRPSISRTYPAALIAIES